MTLSVGDTLKCSVVHKGCVFAHALGLVVEGES